MARSSASSCGARSRPVAPNRGLLRGWLRRLLAGPGSPQGPHTDVVFDPASFLKPRRGRWAKTDRLDAEGMTRTLRSWLGGDSSVAREVRIPTVEEEDAKRLCRERKALVNERTRLVGRLKGLCALHGILVPTENFIRSGLRPPIPETASG